MADQHRQRPPALARWLLCKIAAVYHDDQIKGDLEEAYHLHAKRLGRRAAGQWFYRQVLFCLVKSAVLSISWAVAMIPRYLKSTWRHFRQHRLLSGIKLAGLALAAGFFMLASLFVQQNLSYDRFHEQGAHLYLGVVRHAQPAGSRKPSGCTPPILASTLKDNFPEIERISRINGWGIYDGVPVSVENTVMKQSGYYVDAAFAAMFSFPVLSGDLQAALSAPHGVAITKEMAARLFGEEEALGRQIYFRIPEKTQGRAEPVMRKAFEVMAVLEKPPFSSLKFDFLLPYISMASVSLRWGANSDYTFIQLREGLTPEAFEQKNRAYFNRLHRRGQFEIEAYAVRLIPMKKLYLNTQIRPGFTLQGEVLSVWMLSVMALAVLIMACVNFVNLSLGDFASRMKDVGMRKVLGAARHQLIRQYILESLTMSLAGVCAGCMGAWLALPLFQSLMGVSLNMNWRMLAFPLVLLIVVLTLLTGGYPAAVLSRVQPLAVLKNQLVPNRHGRLRKIFLLIQFTLSILFIILAVAMRLQMTHLRQLDTGYSTEHVLVLDGGERGAFEGGQDLRRLFHLFEEESLQNPGIQSLCLSSMSFGRGRYWGTSFTAGTVERLCRVYGVEGDYTGTLGLKVIQGRAFSAKHPADGMNHVLINEAMAEALELREPVGQSLHLGSDQLEGTIVGVVNDTFLRSMRDEMQPAIYHNRIVNGYYRYILLRLDGRLLAETLELIEALWKEAVPELPFTWSFLQDDFSAALKEDDRWGQIMGGASIIAIVIACLGALGLSLMAVAQRMKDIGIRKVLGASRLHLLTFFLRDFLYLLLCASLLAWPVAWLILQNWLATFAYRISITPLYFFVGTVAAGMSVLVTAGILVFQAVAHNPIKHLRQE